MGPTATTTTVLQRLFSNYSVTVFCVGFQENIKPPSFEVQEPIFELDELHTNRIERNLAFTYRLQLFSQF